MARNRFEDDFIDPTSLVGVETGLAPVDPFLSAVAPGLIGPSDSQFASKELNVGREAVTGGRSFRNPRVRSKTAEEQTQEAIALSRGISPQYNAGLATTMAAQNAGAQPVGRQMEGGMGSIIGQEFGLGVLSNVGKNLALTGGLGLQMGAGGGDIAGAVPGAVAGAVKGAIAGPLGAGLSALGVSDAVASPIGAVNTIGGLAGTALSADIAEGREEDSLSYFGGSPEASPEVRAAMERAAAPPRGTGLLGLLGEGMVSSIGDLTGLYQTKSPIEQAQLAGLKEASRQKYSGTEYGLYKDPEAETPSLASRAIGRTGSAISSGLEAIGGYGSKQDAIDAGFQYMTDESGQISISPPSMNVFGLDDRERSRQQFNESAGIGIGGGRGSGFDSAGGLGGSGGWGGPRGGEGGGYGF